MLDNKYIKIYNSYTVVFNINGKSGVNPEQTNVYCIIVRARCIYLSDTGNTGVVSPNLPDIFQEDFFMFLINKKEERKT